MSMASNFWICGPRFAVSAIRNDTFRTIYLTTVRLFAPEGSVLETSRTSRTEAGRSKWLQYTDAQRRPNRVNAALYPLTQWRGPDRVGEHIPGVGRVDGLLACLLPKGSAEDKTSYEPPTVDY